MAFGLQRKEKYLRNDPEKNKNEIFNISGAFSF